MVKSSIIWFLKGVERSLYCYGVRKVRMERTIKIHIQRLPEGVYLATSDDIQGLVVQGRTVAETLEIARDVARKLIEAQSII
jgi:predicted RNase H-like HicB family nuclease